MGVIDFLVTSFTAVWGGISSTKATAKLVENLCVGLWAAGYIKYFQ